MLTGKAKEDFENYYNNSTVKVLLNFIVFDDLPVVCKCYLIINWFDSVGYTIDRDSYGKTMTITNWTDGNETRTFVDCDYLNPFLEWFEAAIIEANDLYNRLKKQP